MHEEMMYPPLTESISDDAYMQIYATLQAIQHMLRQQEQSATAGVMQSEGASRGERFPEAERMSLRRERFEQVQGAILGHIPPETTWYSESSFGDKYLVVVAYQALIKEFSAELAAINETKKKEGRQQIIQS